MKPYIVRQFEDPIDGPDPTKSTKYLGSKRRPSKKRKARVLKKGVRQDALKESGE